MAGVARADSKWRLLLVQPEDSELVTRVEGQTRDLGVRVDVLSRGWASGDADEAQRLAAKRGMDFVARIERAGNGGLEVRVYAAKSKSLRVRNVPARGRGERLASSAEMEAAALVLRGELTALMQEGDGSQERRDGVGGVAAGGVGASGSGGSARTQEDEHEHEHEHEHEDEGEDEREDEEVREDEEDVDEDEEDEEAGEVENFSSRQGAWTVRLGGRGSLPVDEEFSFGGLIGVRRQFGWLEVGLAGSVGLPFEVSDDFVRIRLSRYSLAAEALGVVPWGPRLRALFGVASGVVLYARKTDSVAVGYEANGSEGAWSATLGAQAELQWVFARQWGLALGGGLDLITTRTQFTYTTAIPGQKTEIAALRGWEPWGTLCLFGLFGD